MEKKSGAHQRDWKRPGDGVPKSVSSRADLGELPLEGLVKKSGPERRNAERDLSYCRVTWRNTTAAELDKLGTI